MIVDRHFVTKIAYLLKLIIKLHLVYLSEIELELMRLVCNISHFPPFPACI